MRVIPVLAIVVIFAATIDSFDRGNEDADAKSNMALNERDILDMFKAPSFQAAAPQPYPPAPSVVYPHASQPQTVPVVGPGQVIYGK